MQGDKKKIIEEILKSPPLFGHPSTRHTDKLGWQWDKDTLNTMTLKDLNRIKNVVERV